MGLFFAPYPATMPLVNKPGSYVFNRTSRLFTQSQANGNLTEIGFFQFSSGGPMWSRSLIKDANGQPTTLTKTSEYELRVVYEVRLAIPGSDAVYAAPVNGQTMNITARPYHIDWWYAFGTAFLDGWCYVYTGAIGPTNGGPAGSYFVASARGPASYGSGNLYRDCLYTWTANNANASVQSFAVGLEGGGTIPSDAAKFQHQLSAPISKVNTQKLEITIRASWGRV